MTHALNKEQIKSIVDLLLANTRKQLADRKLGLEVTDAAKEIITNPGFDPMYGAQPPIEADYTAHDREPHQFGDFHEQSTDGDTIVIDGDGEKIVLTNGARAAGKEPVGV